MVGQGFAPLGEGALFQVAKTPAEAVDLAESGPTPIAAASTAAAPGAPGGPGGRTATPADPPPAAPATPRSSADQAAGRGRLSEMAHRKAQVLVAL